MALLELKQVAKSFGTQTVLAALDLTVGDCELLVLVGPSGCGKSTLLRLIAGLEEPTAGTITLDGRDLTPLPPKNRDVAMVFQNYALYPHLTVYDNLAFGIRRRLPLQEKVANLFGGEGRHKIDQQVRHIAKLLQIEALLTRRPSELSGGQKQRVALGRAMVRNPKLYLMDEPLSNLDAQLRTQTRTQIVQWQHELATTTIYVTHDQTEAMTMGTRIAVMNRGYLQQVDTPLKIYREPANLFVAGFIGEPQMNFLPCQWDGECLIGEGFTLPLPEHYQGVKLPELLILGIRPEYVYLTNENMIFKGTVQLLETLGRETLVYCNIPGGALHLRLNTEPYPEIGLSVGLGVDPVGIHLFERTSEGKRILPKMDGQL